MIAIYHNHESSPFTLYVLEVENDRATEFLEAVCGNSYPFPTSEVVFLDNNKVVNQYWID